MSRKLFSLLWPIGLLLAGCTGSKTGLESPSGISGTRTIGDNKNGIPGTRLANCRRVVFLGDSITYSGQFINYVEMALRRFAPDREFEFLDLGLPSETLSGLSEPNHAGGAFPRPNLHERLERLLELTRPDLVIACYGMNDGIYYPFSQEKSDAFQRGMLLLRQRALTSGAKIIHLTPPVFDSVPIRKNTLPAGQNEYRKPFEGYDSVLEHYSKWLLENRKNGWEVIDVHAPMKNFLESQRLDNPSFHLASDGVHLNENGHWLIAHSLLPGLQARIVTERITLNLTTAKAKGPGIGDSHKHTDGVEFSWQTHPPLPLRSAKPEPARLKGIEGMPLFGQHCFVATTGKAPTYDVFESGRRLANVSLAELSEGIDTRRFPELITTARGQEIMALIQKRNRLLSDSWLTTIGHKRPGMEKGLPIKEVIEQAAVLNSKIKELNQPVELRFRLVPVLNAE